MDTAVANLERQMVYLGGGRLLWGYSLDTRVIIQTVELPGNMNKIDHMQLVKEGQLLIV